MSESHLRQFIEFAPAALAMFDREMRYLAASRRWSEQYKLGDQALVGRSHYDVFPDMPERYRRVHARCIKEGVTISDEDIYYRDNGEELWTKWTCQPWRDENGAVGGLIAMTEIVTERRLAEQEIRDRKAFLRQIIDLNPNLIYAKDEQGRYTMINQAAAEFAGRSVEEVIGKTDQDLWPVKEHARHFRATDFQVLRSGEDLVVGDEPAVDSRGETHLLHTTKRPIVAPGGQRQILGVSVDVTEARRNAAELRAARDAAEEATRAKSSFLAHMSHEIRTPITAILGYSELLLNKRYRAEDHDAYLDIIRRNGKHLLSVINDLLDVSKIEAGRMTVELMPCAIEEVVSEVGRAVGPKCTEKQLHFSVQIDPATPKVILTDPTRLRQILLNLLGNAVKFTERGTVSVRVRLDDSVVRFEVQDSGIGLTPEQQAKLFVPFSQADASTSRRFGGTGLGLAICRSMTQLLGGEIGLLSVPGEGSTFWFTLPATVVDAAAEPHTASSIEPENIQARILLAEDGADNRLLFTTILRSAGAAVVDVENGLAAIEEIESAVGRGAPYDLVLMDMQMPQCDGYQATRELRKRGHTLPIIALTAHAMGGAREECLSAGCSDFLTKPLESRELLNRVAAHLPRTVGSLRSEKSGDAVLAQIIPMFIAELPAQVEKIESLVRAEDAAGLKSVLHQLKGAGGGYGFPQITKLAGAAEQAVKTQGLVEESIRQVRELIGLIERVEGYAAPTPTSL